MRCIWAVHIGDRDLYDQRITKEKHKLVHTIYRSLDRESNPRPLAYGNTASIEWTTTLTTKPNRIQNTLLWYGSPGDLSQGIEGRYVWPWSLNFLRTGFGLVVSVVVPAMLAVLPYARGRGFDSRSRPTNNIKSFKLKRKLFSGD
jgi:hypothetical protein